VQHLKGGKVIIFEAALSRFPPNISASHFLKYPDTFAIRPFKKYGKNLLISKDSAGFAIRCVTTPPTRLTVVAHRAWQAIASRQLARKRVLGR
jgi:hypothetical protein